MSRKMTPGNALANEIASLVSENRRLKHENGLLKRDSERLAAYEQIMRSTRPHGMRAAARFLKLLDDQRKDFGRQLQRAIEQRDQARREYCRMYSDWVDDERLNEMGVEEAASIVAKDLGWDCFDVTLSEDCAEEGCVTGKEAKDGATSSE